MNNCAKFLQKILQQHRKPAPPFRVPFSFSFHASCIAALAVCLALTACGSTDGSETASSSGISGDTAAAGSDLSSDSSGQDISEPWGTAGDNTGETSAEKSGSADTNTSDDSADAQSSGLPETVVDTDDLYFAITGDMTDSVMGYTWYVSLENRTDQNLMYSMGNVSVNGVMCDPFWAEVVSAGDSTEGEISWMQSNLEENGTENVTEVEFTLTVYNDDDYTASPLLHQTFTVYPQGKDKASEVRREDRDSDEVLIDNDRCRILVTSWEPENIWGYTVHLYLQNKSDEDLVFSAENTSLNGKKCDPYWATVVAAGKSANSSITWDTETMEKNGLSADGITSVTLPLLVYSGLNAADPYVEETVTLKPQD